MLRTLFACAALACSTALAACTPSPQDAAMRRSSLISPSAVQSVGEAMPAPPAPVLIGQDAADPGRAAQGPMVEPVSAAENSLPNPPTDSPAAAAGRRIVSTAFVRVGPDGYLTVERHDGHALVLRNVVMGASDYCGEQMSGGAPGKRYCGSYAEVAAARPGGGPRG